MREVLRDLERLRRRGRALLILQRGSAIFAAALAAVAVLIAIDFLLRFPSPLRFVLLAGLVAGLVYLVVRYLAPALRFTPTLTQLALRVEGALPALRGRLASSVEFAAAGVDERNPLAARSVADARSRLAGESLGAIVDRRLTLRSVALAALLILFAAVVAVPNPAVARTGLTRLMLPFSDAQWPARTGVASMMDEVLTASGVHPRGQALPLRAKSTKNPDDRVNAHYRLVVDGEAGPWREILLTHQGEGVHERLVDSNAEAIEVVFATADARTDAQRIALVPPPAVRRATLDVYPPDYAAAWIEPVTHELGPGTDDRAVTPEPSLAGSRITLTLRLNKPIPLAHEGREASSPPASGAQAPPALRNLLGWPEDAPLPELDVHGSTLALTWTLDDTRRLNLKLVDEYGLANDEPIAYRIDAVPDASPTVTITDPPSDETVLPTAVVPLRAEADDDVALVELGLEAQIERTDGPTPTGEPWSRSQRYETNAAAFTAELDLTDLAAQPGDAVIVHAFAADVRPAEEAHAAVRSAPRRLRVVTDLEFATQMRRALGSVRQNAIRVEALQAELQDAVIEDGVQPGVKRAQAQLAERIAEQREAVTQVERQAAMNRLDDAQLNDLLAQSRDLLDFAGRAAAQAVQAIDQREAGGAEADAESRDADESDAERDAEAGAEDKGGADHGDPAEDADDAAVDDAGERLLPERPEPADADRPIVDAQQSVRDELTDLIELLDRDEGTWVMKRRLESLLDEQADLQAQTNALSNRTIGREREQLNDEERSELDRIADRQRDLRDRAQEMMEEMRERAEAMEDVDPQAAESMRRAAETAERQDLDREMENAAQQARQNQLRNAQAAQQAAGQTMQRMLDDIEQTRTAQVEQLLRQLDSLIDSIERLVTVQENELVALAQAEHEGSFAGRDRAMIRLNQNTRAVSAEARSESQTRRVARSLDRAADAQGAAVTALRDEPVVAEDVRDAEERSLALLNEARQLAETMREETQQQQLRQQREELIAAYREMAERQTVLRQNTQELAQADELGRRELVEARLLGTRQDELRQQLWNLRETTQPVADAMIFDHTHRLIDTRAGDASRLLQEGRVDADVTDRQAAVADSIGRLIAALEETIMPPDRFADGQQDGGGQSGGSGGQPQLIPPVAEIKLLRGLQEQVYEQTRSIDTRADLDDARRRERLRDLGELQRDLLHIGEQMLQSLAQQPDGGGDPGSVQEPPQE